MKHSLCILLLMLLASTAPAGIIFSEDFEGGIDAETIPVGVIAGTQFEVVSGNVDHIKNDASPANPYAVMCGSGGSCIDTTGSQGRGEIRTIDAIDFLPGTYYLSFSLQGWKDYSDTTETAMIQVLLPGLVDATFLRDGAANPYPIERILFDVLAPQSVKLTFRDLSGSAGYAGAILDDVVIGTATAGDAGEVPEPSTLLLSVPVLAGLAILRRRGKR